MSAVCLFVYHNRESHLNNTRHQNMLCMPPWKWWNDVQTYARKNALNRFTTCAPRKFDQYWRYLRNLRYSTIGSRIRAFDWYRKWWPWMTLSCVVTVICINSPKAVAFGTNYYRCNKRFNDSRWLIGYCIHLFITPQMQHTLHYKHTK